MMKTLEIGAVALDFNVPGIDGINHTLNDFKDTDILVIVFTCNHCPTALAYEDRIIKLVKDYKNKGAKLVGISFNDPQALRLDELGHSGLGDTLT